MPEYEKVPSKAELTEQMYGIAIKKDCLEGLTLNDLCHRYKVSRFIMKIVLESLGLTVKPSRPGQARRKWLDKHKPKERGD